MTRHQFMIYGACIITFTPISTLTPSVCNFKDPSMNEKDHLEFTIIALE